MPRPVTRVAGLVATRRGRDTQPDFSAAAFEHRDVARVLHVAQAHLQRVDVERRRHLVHERLAGEVDLPARRDRAGARCAAASRARATARWSPTRCACWRTRRIPPARRTRRSPSSGTPRKCPASVSAGWLPLVSTSKRGEALADELVRDDLAGRIDRGARAVDEAGPFGSQPMPSLAHVLHAHRTSGGLREHGRVDGAVVGVVASVGARDRPPRSRAPCPGACRASRDAVAHEMRLLRAAPAGDVAVPISTTAQAGPMQACDWNGHSYSASTTRAAVRNASSTLPTGLTSSRLVPVPCGCGRRCAATSGNGGAALDHSTLSFWYALTASHSLSATTARKLFSRTTRAPAMSWIELSSTLTTRRAGHRRADHAGMQHARDV